jgi:YVTN family beta-propeller protein
VYAADAANNAIYVYNNVPNATPARVITTGINSPQGLTADGSGNLYVANAGANDVLVFAPGSSTPSRTYTQGLARPSDVAVSTTGELYVTNAQGGNVVVYPPGSITPSITWQSPVANSQTLGIALQNPAGGDAYVAYESPGGGGVLQCPIGDNVCVATGISVPGAFAVAPQYTTSPLSLFVSDVNNNVVDVFQLRHGRTPAAQIHTAGTPFGVALDSTFTHLYVANQTATGGQLNEYAYPGGTPLTSFLPPKTAKPALFTGVALASAATTATPPPTANLFVANEGSNSISAFDTAAGNAALPSITGSGLKAPSFGAALDASGKLYVTNGPANSVSVFDTVNGNALLTTITGNGLNGPTGVALDAAGNLLVANGLGNSVSVFAANGYAPVTIITGNQLNSPAGLVVANTLGNTGTCVGNLEADGAINILFVTNARGNSVSEFFFVPGLGRYVPGRDSITNGLSLPQGVAVDDQCRLYVANSGNNSVSVFQQSLGVEIDMQSITGGGLDEPGGVALDASGKLYVTNFVTNSLSVFDTKNGDNALPPITGAGIDEPTAVAVH